MINILRFVFQSVRNAYGRFILRKILQNRFPSVSWPENIQIIGPHENLVLGKNIQFGEYSLIHLGGYPWSQHKGNLKIGDHCNISSHCVIFAAGPGGVEIGSYFDCAPGVKIFSSKSFFEGNETKHDFKKVSIGNHVIIYANSVISPGVKITDNVIIAANSVVTKNIEAPGLYGGIPARKLD